MVGVLQKDYYTCKDVYKNGMNNIIVQKKKIYGLYNKNFIHGLKLANFCIKLRYTVMYTSKDIGVSISLHVEVSALRLAIEMKAV